MPRRSAAAILSVPMSKPRYTAVESQLMISPSKRSAIASASALLPVAVGPRTATALALFKVAHGHAAFVSTERRTDCASRITVRLKPDTTGRPTTVRRKPDTTGTPTTVRLKPDTSGTPTTVRLKPDTTGVRRGRAVRPDE